MVRELYAVEDEANAQIAVTKDCTPVEADAIRLALRQAKSVPILATIKAWLDSEQKLVLPRSLMAQAIGYLLNQWEALCIYTTQGFLNIDNNAAERALRRVGIGRNYVDHRVMRSRKGQAVTNMQRRRRFVWDHVI